MSALAEAFNSRGFHKWFPWVGGATLVAGVIAALVLIVPNTKGNTNLAPAKNSPAPTIVKNDKLLKKVPPEVRRVAGKFILTAVVRQHLDQAWKLIGPGIRQGQTYKQWMSGNIAVQPFFGGIKSAPMAVDYVVKDDVLLQVLLVPQHAGKGIKPEVFWIRVRKLGQGDAKRWLVNEWVPRISAPIPATPDK